MTLRGQRDQNLKSKMKFKILLNMVKAVLAEISTEKGSV